MTKRPISAGATELNVLGYGFERSGGTATFDGGETFTFGAFVRIRPHLRFTGCAGIQDHPGTTWIYYRHPSRGNEAYFSRWALNKYPIENSARQGRVERFSSEVLNTIDLGNGHMADWFFVYTMTYKTKLRGGTAQTISGGR